MRSVGSRRILFEYLLDFWTEKIQKRSFRIFPCLENLRGLKDGEGGLAKVEIGADSRGGGNWKSRDIQEESFFRRNRSIFTQVKLFG